MHGAVLMVFSFFILCGTVSAEEMGRFLVEDGQPRAEIVIAENLPRTTLLAAQELQTYVEKLSGAELAIIPQTAINKKTNGPVPPKAS